MPPHNFTDAQAATVVALPPEHGDGPHRDRRRRCFAASATRRAAGRSSKGKGQCTTCHRVNGRGPRLAPDLSDVGATRPLPELQQALLDPNATMRAGQPVRSAS